MSEESKEILNNLIQIGKNFNYQNFSSKGQFGHTNAISPQYISWYIQVEAFIIDKFGESNPAYLIFKKANLKGPLGYGPDQFFEMHSYILGALESATHLTPIQKNQKIGSIETLILLLKRFHLVSKQLRDRYNNRNTLDINDEYDVQDLIHSLLKIYFDDIRKEEWTPSYAGGSSRMDFLIKEHRTVIEVKKTRQGLGEKEIGKQFIEDIAKYKVHQDCQKLVCFVYDPEGRIPNPKGLKNDLEVNEENFQVIIIINPEGL